MYRCGLTQFKIKLAFKDLKIEFTLCQRICSITPHVVQFMRKMLEEGYLTNSPPVTGVSLAFRFPELSFI